MSLCFLNMQHYSAVDHHAIHIWRHNYHRGHDGQTHGLLAPLPLFEVLPHLVNFPLHGMKILLLFPQFTFQLIFAFHLLLQKTWNRVQHHAASNLHKSWYEHRSWVFEKCSEGSVCGLRGKKVIGWEQGSEANVWTRGKTCEISYGEICNKQSYNFFSSPNLI